MCSRKFLIALFVAGLFAKICLCYENSLYRRIRSCINQNNSIVCLKEEALGILNETINSDIPLKIYDTIEIAKDPKFKFTEVDDMYLPETASEKNDVLNNLLHEKIEEYFNSRTVRFSLANVFEGRKKKDKGGILMMGGLAMAGMMAQLFMGKIAFLAGAALLIAKMALMLSTLSSLKKLSGGGGSGETTKVVYATSSDSYGGGGGYGSGGSWHRSLNSIDDNHDIYKAIVPNNNNMS